MTASQAIEGGRVRPPAVAGRFYPGDPDQLSLAVNELMSQVDASVPGNAPKAIIGPHAGYPYSGPIAASAYTPLLSARGFITRVIIISPSHRAAFTGLALPTADAFAIPGATFTVDRDAVEQLRKLPDVHEIEPAHAPEHGIEVHLPFVAHTLGSPTIVPLLFGDVDHEAVAGVIDALWGGPDTLIVISSDLSHYLDYDTARRVDHATSQSILGGEVRRIGPSQACGHTAVRALMRVADRRGLTARNLDLRNSGDTAGPRDEVVGYGAFTFN